jgi:hypothetical protein
VLSPGSMVTLAPLSSQQNGKNSNGKKLSEIQSPRIRTRGSQFLFFSAGTNRRKQKRGRGRSDAAIRNIQNKKLVLTPSPPMDQLTNTERLLLAQAVYQEGADDWSKVSQLISNHPLIGRPKSYFNPSVRPQLHRLHPRHHNTRIPRYVAQFTQVWSMLRDWMGERSLVLCYCTVFSGLRSSAGKDNAKPRGTGSNPTHPRNPDRLTTTQLT